MTTQSDDIKDEKEFRIKLRSLSTDIITLEKISSYVGRLEKAHNANLENLKQLQEWVEELHEELEKGSAIKGWYEDHLIIHQLTGDKKCQICDYLTIQRKEIQ